MENAKRYESVMKRLRLQSGRWTLLMLVLLLSACTRSSPEQALRTQLQDMQKAVENGEIRDAMAAVAEDFSGPRGMERAALHNLLRMQVLGGRRVGVTTTPYQIELRGDAATVRFNALLTASGQGQWLPQQAQNFDVTLGWRLRGDDWQLHYADWQAGGAGSP